MHAIVARRRGPPEVMEWREVADPTRAEGEVLVRVRVAGVNFADLAARLGLCPGSPTPPMTPGLEVAGVVEGADEGGMFEVGDHVAAILTHGGYAEFTCAPATHAFRLPANMPFEDAAALTVNYLAAHHFLFAMGNLHPGDRVLVHGAAGGVGVAVAQLAKARGLEVFGVAGPSKQEFLRSLGVHRPIDYSKEDFGEVVRREAPGGVEMVIDAVGGQSFRTSYNLLAPTGRLVVAGFSTPLTRKGKPSLATALAGLLAMPKFRPMRLLNENKAVIGVHLGRLGDKFSVLHPQFAEILRLYAEGTVRPIIGRIFPLREAGVAHWLLHRRENTGKVLLRAAYGQCGRSVTGTGE